MQARQEFPCPRLTFVERPFPEAPATAPSLVVLAAGLGSRFGGDKQFSALGPRGETLMDYAVFDAARAGIDRVVVILREASLGQLPALQLRYGARVEVAAAVQRLEDVPAGTALPRDRVRPWGSAQALLAARDVAGSAFLVVNGDDFYGRDAYRQLVAARAADATRWHLAGFRLGDTLSPQGTVNRAVCAIGPGSELLGLEEVSRIARHAGGRITGEVHGHTRLLAAADVVSMNMWSLTSDLFPVLGRGFSTFLAQHADLERGEYYLPQGIAEGISAGHAVQVLPVAAEWCGVTYKEDADTVRTRLADLTRRGEYPSPLWP